MPTTKWVIRRPDGKYISPPDCAVWDTEAEVIEAIAKSHRPQNGKDGMNLPRYLLRYLPRSCLAGVCALPHTPYQRSRAGRVACPSLAGFHLR